MLAGPDKCRTIKAVLIMFLDGRWCGPRFTRSSKASAFVTYYSA